MKILNAFALLLLVLSLSACGLGASMKRMGQRMTERFASPQVEISSVRIDKQTLSGARFLIDLELTNPNDKPLPLLETTYTVRVGDESFHFVQETHRALPASGRQTITVSAAIATDGGKLTGRDYQLTGDISYDTPTGMRAAGHLTWMPRPVVRFAGTGTLQ